MTARGFFYGWMAAWQNKPEKSMVYLVSREMLKLNSFLWRMVCWFKNGVIADIRSMKSLAFLNILPIPTDTLRRSEADDHCCGHPHIAWLFFPSKGSQRDQQDRQNLPDLPILEALATWTIDLSVSEILESSFPSFIWGRKVYGLMSDSRPGTIRKLL